MHIDNWQVEYSEQQPFDFTRGHAFSDISDADSLELESIPAFIVGLKSKLATFDVQRQVNTFSQEPCWRCG